MDHVILPVGACLRLEVRFYPSSGRRCALRWIESQALVFARWGNA
jgi:hypothetical protein